MSDEAMDFGGGGGDSDAQSGGSFEWSVPQDELDFYEADLQGAGRDAVIFAIDFSPMMFQQCNPKQEGKKVQSALKTTIEAVREAVISRIYRSEQDFLSIVLYNTFNRSVDIAVDHVNVVDPLQRPGVEVVKKLDKLLEMDADELQAKFGSVDKCAIGDLLSACSSIFAKLAQKTFSKRILLFTANDNPHRGSKKDMLYAKQKASDNFEAGISMSLFALELQNGHFDPTKFWDDVIVAGSADDDDQRVAPMGDWEDLTALITRKDHSRRAMGNLSLILGEGLELSVSVFTLVRTANKPPAVKLWKKTNQQVEKPERMTMDEESATVLMPTDMQKYMDFAGKKIFFRSEEIQAMKHFGSTGIRVIAFKSLDALKEKHHIRPAQFLYPNEGDIRGSTKLFIALLTKCLEKRVMAVCRYSPRENISPKLVGLVPQEEVLGEQGEQLTPAGFHIIFFPFADDFRGNNPAPKNAPVADEAQIAKARELVKKLKFPYSPEDFPNPALHTHLKNIQALALGEEIKTDEDGHRILNDFTDYTEPQTAGIERKVGKLLKEFISLVYPHGYDPEGAHTKKRVYEKKEPVTKRGPAAASQGTGADDIAQAAEAGNLKKYTLPILKEYCKSHKVKVEGSKKDDYIGAIETHLAGND